MTVPESLDFDWQRLAELEWFGGRRVARKQWECTRVELNALGSVGLVKLIEAGLRRHRATGKVVPPREVIASYGRAATQILVREVAEEVFRELGLDVDELADCCGHDQGDDW